MSREEATRPARAPREGAAERTVRGAEAGSGPVPVDASARSTPQRVPSVRSATLPCEVCGEETPHRILRLEPRGSGSAGIARCSRCRWTHPFEELPPRTAGLWLVVSEGRRSRREPLELPARTVLAVEEALPGPEPAWRVTRLERPDGRTSRVLRAEETRTVWAVPWRAPAVAVSLIEGARTRPLRWTPSPGSTVRIGERVEIAGVSAFVVGFRARGRTWRRSGDAMPVEELDRLYARRIARPPAGSSDWSRGRGRPRSRTSSTSISARRRSSPGVTR